MSTKFSSKENLNVSTCILMLYFCDYIIIYYYIFISQISYFEIEDDEKKKEMNPRLKILLLIKVVLFLQPEIFHNCVGIDSLVVRFVKSLIFLFFILLYFLMILWYILHNIFILLLCYFIYVIFSKIFIL